MIQNFRRNVLSSRLVIRKILFFQPPKHALRNSNPRLFHSSLPRSYTNSISKESEKWKSVFFNVKRKFPVQVIKAKLHNINWKEQMFGMWRLLLSERFSTVSDDEYIPQSKDIERLMIIFQTNQIRLITIWFAGNVGLVKQHCLGYRQTKTEKVYKANNEDRPPVIVYEDGAKNNADDRKYIAAVKVRYLEGWDVTRSAWSRAKKSDGNRHKKVDKFDAAKLHQDQPYHEGKRVIKTLLDSNQMLDYLTYRKFFNNPEEANNALEANVFAYHPKTRTVTFQCRAIEFYIRENADMFLK
ncbi:10500_t:CDS:2 [Diversispora eburnea]|uniref:10500_t:CDS:1 n=1 Tax=Diversispora eburnea TaxID=1213867 RepID=A0A9N8VIF3_9GLOM|nr:10500_t:CDS:2 [Diversispora eburnea]